MTNEQEIKAKADQAVISFYNSISPFKITIEDIDHYRLGSQFYIATQCAILMYEDRVKSEYKDLSILERDGVSDKAWRKLKSKHADTVLILTELRSRV